MVKDGCKYFPQEIVRAIDKFGVLGSLVWLADALERGSDFQVERKAAGMVKAAVDMVVFWKDPAST